MHWSAPVVAVLFYLVTPWHSLLPDVQKVVRVPITDMIAVTAREVCARGWDRALLLATNTTVQTKLYQRALVELGIKIELPNKTQQRQLDRAIVRLVNGTGLSAGREFISTLVEQSKAEGVILGCTDLQLVQPESERVVDSVQALVRHIKRNPD